MTSTSATKVPIEFNDKVVRQFMLASIIFGVVAMLAGVLIASQLESDRSAPTAPRERAEVTPQPGVLGARPVPPVGVERRIQRAYGI